MKSIKTKILVTMATAVLAVAIINGTVSSVLSYQGTMKTLKVDLSALAVSASDQICKSLEIYRTIAVDLGCTAQLSAVSASDSEKALILGDRVDSFKLKDAFIANTDGSVQLDSNKFISSLDYFTEALAGNTFVSSPVADQDKKSTEIYISAPLWNGGKVDTKVVGVVVIVVDGKTLSDIANEAFTNSTGGAYIINKVGDVIAHSDYNLVLAKDNTIKDAVLDKGLKPLASMEAKLIAGKSGFGAYSYKGIDKFLAYAPIKDSNGWGMAITAMQNEYTSNITKTIFYIIILSVILVFLGIAAAYVISSAIAKPIKICANRLSLLAQGDLSSEIPTSKSKDETGVLLSELKNTIYDLRDAISDVEYHLSEIAAGNLTTEVTHDYKGDFKPLEESTKKIIASLHSAMSQIDQSALQVSTGSEQIAAGAQILSQGATEQASSIEELSATIGEVSTQVRKNAENASLANQISAKAEQEMQAGNEQMNTMIEAMREINGSSSEIGKIIKSIEDIAFQTNILALNAAVEAARAGDAGKGFAVVADEVRNLAVKSAAAANNTTALIEDSARAVSRGTNIANKTYQSLTQMVDDTQKAAALVEQIAVATNEQANSLLQISQGIDQISMVVQTNSATSEESSASSEELSGQAQILKDLVQQFKLK